MERKTVVIKEEPIFASYGRFDEIEIYADELKAAEIGKEWQHNDQNAECNASEYWTVFVKKIFEDEHGCLLIKRDNYYERYDSCFELPELIWVEYRTNKKEV